MFKNSDMPYCSIIVLNYNAKEYLDKCLKSLQDINYPKDRYQIVLVDNASTDGSVEFVKKNFPEIRLIANKQNFGFMKGNNIALKAIESEYYVLLNPDTFVDKDWLINLVEVAKSDGSIGLCSSKILAMDDKSKINYAGGMVNFLGFSWPRGFDEKDDGRFGALGEIGFASGASMLIKKDVLDRIGLLDEDFFMYYEDVDYSWRARLFGYKVVYVPKSLVYHKHEGSVKKSMGFKRKFYHLEKNRVETILKNYSRKSLLFLLPFIVLVELGLVFYFLIFHRSLLKFFGYAHLIRHIKRLFKKRTEVQQNRTVSDKQIFKYFTPLMPKGFVPDKLLPVVVMFFKAYYAFIKKLSD